MITKEQKNYILENIIKNLELPESAYEKARKRYEDLGEWFGREESTVKDKDPHIFAQGSFRLGTAIYPLNSDDAYDLDLACKLRKGVTKDSNTQEFLKEVVGQELEAYRIARGIKAPKEEKHRCWRLEYQDDLSFHMDIVPCIPADEIRLKRIQESIRQSGVEEFLAESASQLTVSITDDRHEGYRQICDNWHISNPEGYSQWFEFRMNQNQQLFSVEKAQVDEIPLFKRKTPLQRSIQLLKRHRDQMFKDDKNAKPTSIIITTLAARAYNGEPDLYSALNSILSQMGELVNTKNSRVPNPVDPGEDFADRWSMPEYKDLYLEQNFWNWLVQAQSDFESILSTLDRKFIIKQVEQKFSLRLNLELAKGLGAVSIVTPKRHSISDPPRLWKEQG